MTQWGGVEMRHILIEAGFPPGEIQSAAAYALIVSRWRDHVTENAGGRVGVERIGLFGVPYPNETGTRRGDLFDPRVNAQVASKLWTSDSGFVSLGSGSLSASAGEIVRALRIMRDEGLWAKRASDLSQPVRVRGSWSQRVDTTTILSSAGHVVPVE